jgi:multiple sugar transport system substrate-binding protein
MNIPFRRTVCAIAASVVVALGVAGCSSAIPAAAPTPTAKPAGTVTFWVGSWWADQIPLIEKAWTAAHPEITVNIEPLPVTGFLDKFTSAALGGTPPDLIELDTAWLPSSAAQGLLQPVDGIIPQADVKDFAPAAWQSSQFKGKQYGIPDRSDPSIMYFNKKVFDDAGVAYPTNQWSYGDMLSDAKALTNPSSNTYGIGYAADLSDPQDVIQLLASVVWGFGGDFLNKAGTKSVINSSKAVAGLRYWAELFTKYHAAPPGTPNFATTRDVVPMFEANQIGLMMGGSNYFSTLDAVPGLSYGIVLAPGGVGESGAHTLSVPVGAKNAAAAKVFLTWFEQTKNLATLMNRTPARLSSLQLPPWNSDKFTTVNESLQRGRSLPSVGSWTQIQTVVITESQKILVGSETAKQAADSMATQIDALLAK